MDYKKITEEALLAHGHNGDRSFECAGVSVSNQSVKACKIYRVAKSQKNLIQDIGCLAVKNPGIVKVLSNTDQCRVFGSSSVYPLNNGDVEYRFGLKLRNSAPIDECRERINNHLMDLAADDMLQEVSRVCDTIILNTGTHKYPLDQIGMRLDVNGSILEYKTYFSLYYYENCEDITGQLLCSDAAVQIINPLGKLFCPVHDVLLDEVCRYSSVIDRAGYRHCLFGINQVANSKEIKFYHFLSDPEQDRQQTEKEASRLLCQLHINVQDINKYYYENGFYLKVIALVLGENQQISWKLYYYLVDDCFD